MLQKQELPQFSNHQINLDLQAITSNPNQINSSILSQESGPETFSKVVIHSVIPSSPENEIIEDDHQYSQLNMNDQRHNNKPNQQSDAQSKGKMKQGEKSVFDKYVMNKTTTEGLNRNRHLNNKEMKLPERSRQQTQLSHQQTVLTSDFTLINGDQGNISQKIQNEVQYENLISHRLYRLQNLLDQNSSHHQKNRSFANQINDSAEFTEFNQQQQIHPRIFANHRQSQGEKIIGPNFAHVCQTVRLKEELSKQLSFSKRKVKQLENQFKDTIKTSRRLKEAQNSMFGGLKNSKNDKYNHNIEFVAKKDLPELQVNGGRTIKFQATLFGDFPAELTEAATKVHQERVENLHIFQQVDENIKQQQERDQRRQNMSALIQQINQQLPQVINKDKLQRQQDLNGKHFLKKKFSDLREQSQSNLKMIREYEKSNRLGSSFWQSYEHMQSKSPNSSKNISRTRNSKERKLDYLREPNEAQKLMWKKFGNTDYLQRPGLKVYSYDQEDDNRISSFSQARLRVSQYKLEHRLINKQVGLKSERLSNGFQQNQYDKKYSITKRNFRKSSQDLIEQEQSQGQSGFPIQGFEVPLDDASISNNEWGQISLKKFELNIN